MLIIDVADYVGAVVREVREVERDGAPARTVVASRSYDTTPEDLWDALTNPERIPRWFSPVTGDLKLGGHYQVQGNAGGTITVCEPSKRFEVTWEFGGGVSWLTVFLDAADDGRTRLTLEHTAVVDPHWGQYGPGAVGVGWDLSLLGLALHVDTKGSADRAESEAWTASPDGKAFMTRAAEDWGRADIASGADPEAARASAQRTIEAYTA